MNNGWLKITLLMLSLLPGLKTLYGAELKQYVEMAKNNINIIDAFDPKNWSFYRAKNAQGNSMLEFHDPKQTPQWRLVSVNDRSPSKIEIEEYMEALKQRQNSNNSIAIGGKLTDIVPLQTVGFISKDENHIVLSFKPKLAELKKSVLDNLQGRLIFSSKNHSLTEISIVNTATLNYSFLTKIKDFKLHMKFMNKEDLLLVAEIESEIQGSFAFVKKFHDISQYRYSDYKPVTEAMDTQEISQSRR